VAIGVTDQAQMSAVEPREGVAVGQGGRTFSMVVADWTNQLAIIDTFESATLIARHNEVSGYEVKLPTDSIAGRMLLGLARPRILFLTEAGVFRSGPVIRLQRTVDDGGDVLTVNGTDDLVWLRRRLAHPCPGVAAPPYTQQTNHVISGAASQVIADYVSWNAGPKAIPARRVANLAVPVPAAFGPNITLSARYQNLLEFLQPAAKQAKIGFAMRGLSFEVFQPVGVAVFSVELGTLAAFESAADVPETDYVYVAGGGEGTARVIREYQDIASVQAWGRIESFVDRRDTTTTGELDQSGAEALAEGIHAPSIKLDVLDTPAQRFLVDWTVGDTATAVLYGGQAITDIIVEAKIELTPNAPPIVQPVLGSPPLDLKAWRRLQGTEARLRQLERV